MVNADLRRADPRWPRFAAQATAAGFSSVHAFPLRLRDQLIGAMNVFSHQTGRPLDESDTRVVQALADVAAIGLVQKRTINDGEALADQLQRALKTRIIIEQAKGAIAHARQVSVEAAFDILRGYARSHHRQLSALAHAVVADPAVLAALVKETATADLDVREQRLDERDAGLEARRAQLDERQFSIEVQEWMQPPPRPEPGPEGTGPRLDPGEP